MPSSYSASIRITLPATGELSNTWGAVLDSGTFTLLDSAIAGWATIALTGNVSLTSANGASDQARLAMLKFTGTGAFTVTVPAVSKRYDVWNACSGVLTLTNGSASVTVQPGEVVSVINDGNANFARVVPTDFGSSVPFTTGSPTLNTHFATKLYADNLAFTANAGIFPGMTGNAGKVVTNDGNVTASWTSTLANFTLTTPTITAPTITGGETLSGGLIYTGSTKQAVTAMAALDIDVSTGEFFTKSISTGSTFTISNPTASKAQAFLLKLTISSSAAPTWPAAVKWANGTAPTLGNGTHLLGFVTLDGGTTWTGLLVAFNYS